ncbi:Transposase IS116/IS110/IS902 family protein [compost metagenome]
MDGISTVTAAELIAEIGDIRRFSNADKLARFAGIAPVRFSSGGKGKDQASGQGNRVLNAIFHNLAVQQIQVAKGDNKKQRNPVFYEFYQRKLAEGKTKKQALICVMRRLVNIIYSMMKNKTEYRAVSSLTELKAG